MRWLWAVMAAALLCGSLGSAPARAADTLETVELTGDPDNRIDLVIVAEGYTTAEADVFRQHVDSLVAGFFAYDPWSNYRGGFNLYRVVTESNESGADHPAQGVYRDTYLDATYDYLGIERLLVVNEGLAASIAANLVPEMDFVVVLVNDELYGGSGGSVATVSATEVAVEILTHELGHTFANLADEYTEPYPGFPPGDDEPNVDFDFAFDDLKWNAWVDPSTPLPSLVAAAVDDYNPVGAYEGARYVDTGIYRPAPSCMMRGVSFDYCAVCRQALVLAIYDWVEPIDDVSPEPGPVVIQAADLATAPARFEVQIPDMGDAAGLSVRWYLDDAPVSSSTALELGPAELGLTDGLYTLRCEVLDPTAWVRTDPEQRLAAERSWELQVVGLQGDAGVGVDGGGGDVRRQPGCHCQTATPSDWLPVFLLLMLLGLASRRRACRTRRSAWRRRRGPW